MLIPKSLRNAASLRDQRVSAAPVLLDNSTAAPFVLTLLSRDRRAVATYHAVGAAVEVLG